MGRSYSGQIHVRVPPKLHEEMARESFEKNISQSGICAQALVVRNALKGMDPWRAIDRVWEQGADVDLSRLEKDIAEAVSEVRRGKKK